MAAGSSSSSSPVGWKKHLTGTRSCMLLRDVDYICDLEKHLATLSHGRNSLEVGRSLPNCIAPVVSHGRYCTMVGQLKGGVVIVRNNGLDISFILVQTSGTEASILRTIEWPLDNFRSKVGCILPGPEEMDFPVHVSCTGCYGVILGPATEGRNRQNRSNYPKVVLVTPTKHKQLHIRHDNKDGWPANLQFHPHIDSVVAVLQCNKPTWDCPYPRFSHTPVMLLLYDVREEAVLSVLPQTPLSPELLSFTSDGKEIVVTSAMQIKNYAVKSVSKGNSCNILMVRSECEEVSSETSQVSSETAQVSSETSQVSSETAQVRSNDTQVTSDTPNLSKSTNVISNQSEVSPSIRCAALSVVSTVPAPDLCDWHHIETDDHVHKSLHTSAVTSLDRRTIHILAVSTLQSSANTVFTYTRNKAPYYVDRLLQFCRVAVLHNVCIDDVDSLPIPQSLKLFIRGF